MKVQLKVEEIRFSLVGPACCPEFDQAMSRCYLWLDVETGTFYLKTLFSNDRMMLRFCPFCGQNFEYEDVG